METIMVSYIINHHKKENAVIKKGKKEKGNQKVTDTECL